MAGGRPPASEELDMNEVTPRQRRILDYIKATVRERGYPPTVREIGEAVGLNSSSSVHAQLANLERRGLLRRDPTKPRAMELQGAGAPTGQAVSVPVIGRIAAGAPIMATDNVEEYLPLPTSFATDDETFALRVSGDSMTGAGILDGDMVVVRSQREARNGDIVAALLGGPAEEEATVKRFQRRDGKVELIAENPAYAPIEMTNGRIIGKVVAVLRRL
jgi:repressor LexA